jgi:hypothetical protein
MVVDRCFVAGVLEGDVIRQVEKGDFGSWGYYQFKPKPKLVEQNSLNQILSKAVLFPVPG